ncbi:MAG: ATP-binding protein [Candidatus Sumerlaeota bacterium]|nr:ATP-binding protein [Candidatus Sumerlaeota bacterium]
MPARLRSNILMILYLLVYAGTIWGIVYTTDALILRFEKAEYIFRDEVKTLQFNPGPLWQLAVRILRRPAPDLEMPAQRQAIAEATAQLQTLMNDLVTSGSPIYYIALLDKDDNEVLSASNPRKVWQRRRWDNTVILNFTHGYTIPLPADRITRETIGKLKIRYTNLLNDPVIAQITARHRPRILGLIAAATALFAYLFYFVLLPVRNVTVALTQRGDGVPSLLPRARATVERAYNQMASDALLMRLDEAIYSIPEKGENYERFEAQQLICRAIADLFGYRQAWIVALTPGSRLGAAEFSVRGAYPETPGGLSGAIHSLDAALLDQDSSRENDAAVGPIEAILKTANQSAVRALAAPLPPVEFEDSRIFLLAVMRGGRAGAAPSVFARELFARVAREAGRSFLERQGRRRRLARERSKANINITRHLGHDLTNIIATSKLDLMAAQDYLRVMEQAEAAGDPRRQMFSEALSAVLRNTRFLQEIVNLYRSFGYIRRPKYEWIDVNEMMREMAELFSYSTSAQIRIEVESREPAPRALLEPRLIRLSLFNLMTNAVEAIQAKAHERGIGSLDAGEPQRIILSAVLSDDGARLRISVCDTGSGIRGRDGVLLPNDRLRDILYLGATTKDEEGAEGLGLDWVRTIVEEFHQGRVVPQNRPEGGAEFIMDIPATAPERLAASGEDGQAKRSESQIL